MGEIRIRRRQRKSKTRKLCCAAIQLNKELLRFALVGRLLAETLVILGLEKKERKSMSFREKKGGI
jgi:hypothetical protein